MAVRASGAHAGAVGIVERILVFLCHVVGHLVAGVGAKRFGAGVNQPFRQAADQHYAGDYSQSH